MGTPGHMAHPFDVEEVNTGQDLIDYINNAVTKLAAGEIAGSVKWEGINTSFKLVTAENGEKDFRMDRGTNHIDSVVGLTAADAYRKWPEGHGMPAAIEKLLSIFNEALPSIKTELETLGLWDDPTRYFNTEYIEGKSNVIDYTVMDIPDKILAIHGINQFYEKKAQPHAIRKGTSMDRPGLKRPIDPVTEKPVKSGGIEIPYDKEALAIVIEKVQPIAAKYDFKIFGDVPVDFEPDHELDIEKTLDDTQLSVEVSPGDVWTRSLREWLKSVQNPKDRMITRADGKTTGAMSKDAYLAVLRSAEEGSPSLQEYYVSQEDISGAIDGAVFYHALRVLGQEVKRALTSEAGNLSNHEGVVLRGLEDFLVKLTGDFIVQGLASTHGQHVSENLSRDFTVVISEDVSITKPIQDWLIEAKEANHKYQKLPKMVYKDILAGVPIVGIVVQENAEKAIYNAVMGYVNGLQEDEGLDVEFVEDETDDPVVDVDFPKTYAIVPGAFKPPHAGHADMVRRYATGDGVPKADEVIVVISAPLEKNRTLRDGTVINEKHAEAMWRDIFPDVTNLPNVRHEVAPAEMRSPITVAYEYIGKNSPLSFNNEDRVILGASKKGDDWKRWRDARKYVQPGIELLSGEEYAVKPLVRAGGVDFSATDMRDLISDLVEDPNNKNALNDLKEFVPADKIDVLFSILDLPSPAVGIEEMAAMAKGAVAGASAPLGSTSAKTGKKKRKKTKQKEYIDLSLIDEVMKLIIERGTMQ